MPAHIFPSPVREANRQCPLEHSVPASSRKSSPAVISTGVGQASTRLIAAMTACAACLPPHTPGSEHLTPRAFALGAVLVVHSARGRSPLGGGHRIFWPSIS